MRYIIMVRANAESEAAAKFEPKIMEDIGRLHEEIAHAGVLIDGIGLKPSSKGFRIHYSGQQRTVIDGPFAETKELVAGFTIIRVNSKDEALSWAKRFPHPFGKGEAEIEVRPLYEEEDFAPGGEMAW